VEILGERETLLAWRVDIKEEVSDIQMDQKFCTKERLCFCELRSLKGGMKKAYYDIDNRKGGELHFLSSSSGEES
jgi:hypothetical protein